MFQSSNLDDRTAIVDLLAEADIGATGKRIVQCNENTLNTPYKAGQTNGKSGTAYVNMSSVGYGTILYIVSGTRRIFLRSKDNGIWSNWDELLKKSDFITKTVSLNQLTVPANAGATGTTNVASQIPEGYKILDAKEVGSGNNGCYVYYFKVDGTNITLQIRNVTNTAITTSLAAKLLLISK